MAQHPVSDMITEPHSAPSTPIKHRTVPEVRRAEILYVHAFLATVLHEALGCGPESLKAACGPHGPVEEVDKAEVGAATEHEHAPCALANRVDELQVPQEEDGWMDHQQQRRHCHGECGSMTLQQRALDFRGTKVHVALHQITQHCQHCSELH